MQWRHLQLCPLPSPERERERKAREGSNGSSCTGPGETLPLHELLMLCGRGWGGNCTQIRPVLLYRTQRIPSPGSGTDSALQQRTFCSKKAQTHHEKPSISSVNWCVNATLQVCACFLRSYTAEIRCRIIEPALGAEEEWLEMQAGAIDLGHSCRCSTALPPRKRQEQRGPHSSRTGQSVFRIRGEGFVQPTVFFEQDLFLLSPGQRTLHHQSEDLETVILVNPDEQSVVSKVKPRDP